MEEEAMTKIAIPAVCEIYDVALLKSDNGDTWWHQARIVAFDSDFDGLIINECLSLEKAVDVRFSDTDLILLRVLLVDGVIEYRESDRSISSEILNQSLPNAKESLRTIIRSAAQSEIDDRIKSAEKDQET